MNNHEKIKINYLAYDYDTIKNSLTQYAQTYFPNSYTDFTDSSPVGFFTGMVSYVGDLLSFYIDKRYQESIMQTATDRRSVVDLAKFLGYNHKPTTASTVDLSVYQLIPKNSISNEPDYNYALKINSGMLVSDSSKKIIFRTLDTVDFSVTGSTEISLYDTQYKNISYFVLKKNVRAMAANLSFETFTFTEASSFQKIKLSSLDVISILSCIDSDGNDWNEVPYLAQDTIAEAIENTAKTNSLYTSFSNQTPYLIDLKKVTKRFIKRITYLNETELMFGAGSVGMGNEDIIPTQNSLSQLFLDSSIADTVIDTRNFLRLDSLGESPSNTALTVTYLRGGGVESNIQSNNLTNIESRVSNFTGKNLDSDKSDFVLNSLSTNNLLSSIGGRGPESTEEIRQNALSYFSGQNRIVTKEDYEIRTLSLDPKFGNISKVFVVKDNEDPTTPELESGTISIYCLSSGVDGKMAVLNEATKYNLKKYLEQYRVLTDNIAIRNAYIINIGVDFSITTSAVSNPTSVLFDCLTEIKKYFAIDKWKIGQPIIKSEIQNLLYNINGVRSINYIKIINKRTGSYSDIYYDMEIATRNEIVYSSLDPAIFEVKYPDTDIKGIIL